MVSPKIALQNGDKNPGCFRLCAEARFCTGEPCNEKMAKPKPKNQNYCVIIVTSISKHA
jgi:hypothetical protein